MRATWLLLSFAALAVPALAADPPSLVVIDPVTPPPAPMPGPAAGVRLEAGRFELVRLTGYSGKVTWRTTSPSAVVVKLPPKAKVVAVPADPDGTASVSVPFSPAEVVVGRKVGAAGGGVYETGDDPAVLVKPGLVAGVAIVEAWGVIDGEPVPLTQLKVETLKGPQPPPGPTPPGPTPDGTSPFPEAGFRVLFTYDSANTTRPAAQNSVLYGKSVRDYLKAKCVAEPGGTGDGKAYRIYPANADVSQAPKTWADAHRLAVGKGKDWVLIGDGSKGYSGPLPATEADMLALLKRFGGE